MVIDLQIAGLDDAIAAVEALDDLSGLMAAHEGALNLLLFAARDYPPPPSGSTYTRSYTLRGGWQPELDMQAGEIVGRIENRVSYAQWVQGDDQAWMHAGRWETAGQIATRLEGEVVGIIEDGVDDWLRGMGW